MRNSNRKLSLLALTLALAIPVDAGARESKDEAAIRAASAAFVAAFNGGDVNGVVVHFAETAVAMPPNAPPLRGRGEIRQFVERGIANARTNGITLTLEPGSDVGASGDLGWHSGSFTISKTGAAIDNGKYLETWRRTTGNWQMIRRIWNSDRAPASK